VRWETLKWEKSKEHQKWGGMKIMSAKAAAVFNLPNAIGVDPGRNWGIGILYNGGLTVYWGKFPKQEQAYRYSLLVGDFVRGWLPEYVSPITRAAIEGPSFGSRFKQVMLEDVRVGFWLGLWRRGKDAVYVPPQTVRKQVFGYGYIKASDLWLAINGNAADAGAVALYAGGCNIDMLQGKIEE